MATEQQIRELAYSLWEQEGYPNGKDWEHYYTARRILDEREAAAAQACDHQAAPSVEVHAQAPEHKHKGRRR